VSNLLQAVEARAMDAAWSGTPLPSAARGTVYDTVGQPLRYGKPAFENPHFIARCCI
jgi:3'-phosphoadenosine 5'-phosphosulfate (PAPS) 3'-phosphatase